MISKSKEKYANRPYVLTNFSLKKSRIYIKYFFFNIIIKDRISWSDKKKLITCVLSFSFLSLEKDISSLISRFSYSNLICGQRGTEMCVHLAVGVGHDHGGFIVGELTQK